MIRLHRPMLSKSAKEFLKNCALSWDHNPKDQVAFLEIKSLLMFANGGSNVCMFCTFSEAGALDHFRPKSPKSPYSSLMYDYDNYVWSCANCNTAKSNAFPLDQYGQPLLVNPLDEDPDAYFNYNRQGLLFLEKETIETDDERQAREKNNATVNTLDLDRDFLVRQRADAWKTLPSMLNCYSRGAIAKSVLTGPTYIAVLTYFWKMRTKPALIGQMTADILEKHPEIGSWVNPLVRSYKDYRQQWDVCIGQRLINMVETPTFNLTFESTQISLPLPRLSSSRTALTKKLKYVFLDQRTLTFHFHNKSPDFTFSLDDLDEMTP